MLAPLPSKLSYAAVATIENDEHTSLHASCSGKSGHSPSNSVLSPSTLTDPTTVSDSSRPAQSLDVLLAIRLEDDFFLDEEEERGQKIKVWCEWLKKMPERAQNVQIQGLYKSCSALMLVSIPILLWDLLPDNAAYSFIGFVSSSNLAHSLEYEREAESIGSAVTTKLELEPSPKGPIILRDAVDRTFNLPFDLCKTWAGTENLIKDAFLYIDVIGPHVEAGHYDLLDKDRNLILPATWESFVQPGWEVSMHMWPMPGIPSRYRPLSSPSPSSIPPLEIIHPQPHRPQSYKSVLGKSPKRRPHWQPVPSPSPPPLHLDSFFSSSPHTELVDYENVSPALIAEITEKFKKEVIERLRQHGIDESILEYDRIDSMENSQVIPDNVSCGRSSAGRSHTSMNSGFFDESYEDTLRKTRVSFQVARGRSPNTWILGTVTPYIDDDHTGEEKEERGNST